MPPLPQICSPTACNVGFFDNESERHDCEISPLKMVRCWVFSLLIFSCSKFTQQLISRSKIHRSSTANSLSRASAFPVVAASLAAGVTGYQGPKVSRSISASSPFMIYPPNRKTYYYGKRNYRNQNDTSLTCNYTISEDDRYFNLTYADTGDKISEILYECKSSSETCCNGLECCNKTLSLWIILLIAFGCLLIVLLCIMLPCLKRRFVTRKIRPPPPAPLPVVVVHDGPKMVVRAP
uniref:CX domain-containing protein n=1 Tax=Romanomermis culicivorax TaxID=13658 RepID=A0A915IYT5_ROMCU